jgi:L-amino acid N-acyltransferase YncA
MRIEVRPATIDDAEAIVAILNPIIAAGIYTAFDTPFTVEAERAFIQNLPARAVLHVADDRTDQRVVGFQIMEPFATYTHAFDHVATLGTYVDLDCRRQGIATGLFQATFAAAVERGFEKIFTFVRADNDGALRTYLRQGFQVVGRARNHARIDGRYIDEVLIEKDLNLRSILRLPLPPPGPAPLSPPR